MLKLMMLWTIGGVFKQPLHLSSNCCLLAIKTGRYTHEKKAEDIKEVKRLEGGEGGSVVVVVPEVDSPRSSGSSMQTSPNPVTSSIARLTDEELQEIINSIVQSYCSSTPYNEEFFEMLPQRERNFLVSVFQSTRKTL